MNKPIFVFLLQLLTISGYTQQDWPYAPTDQPDEDGRVIKGRSGIHHWQPYMSEADLTDYKHAPEKSFEAFRDLKYGLRIHWGIYSILHGRESWIIHQKIKEGSVLTGLILRETDDEILMRQIGGYDPKIKRSEIQQVERMKQSLMRELTGVMTQVEIVNLVACLSSLKIDKIATQ